MSRHRRERLNFTMRRAITTLVLLAVTISAVAQISPGVCPMQGTSSNRVDLATAPLPHCHRRIALGSEKCLVPHTCCKGAPADAQLLQSRWTLAPSGDAVIASQSLANGVSGRAPIHVFADPFGARPPTEKLKTDLRI